MEDFGPNEEVGECGVVPITIPRSTYFAFFFLFALSGSLQLAAENGAESTAVGAAAAE